MHKYIEQIFISSKKESRLIIGLMSGTSLDGLDVALCKISNSGIKTKVELLNFTTVDYDDNYKNKIKAVFAQQKTDLEQVTLLNPWVGTLHGAMVNQCLAKWKVAAGEIDVIASHGQTIYHCPAHQHGIEDFGNGTLQIGDSCHLAVKTGIITLADFRQKHIAAGGEGAPLAVYGDYLLFSSPQENRVLLNMGGIANLTYLPKSTDPSVVFSSDIGPGNTIMDAYVQQHFSGLHYDKDSEIARKGEINQNLLNALKINNFFLMAMPKTTGPEVFNLAYLQRAQCASNTQDLSHNDILATLNRFSAEIIALAINQCTEKLGQFSLYASGGGIHNPLLMEHILSLAPQITIIHNTQVLGIEPDAKEAVLFAILANECLAGHAENFGNPAQGIPKTTMGKISFPI
ncbi:MAG: anhydro-N-acetylmuramic acid kinase [Colwellia sp.]|nr:anhydro-N-acetylmuramic acid kinase [Colwellia sp.]